MGPNATPPWIFLSYRRVEGGVHLAARIKTALETISGPNSIFVDTSGISAGAAWGNVILRELEGCLATIVVISPTWSLEQLHVPNDWVCREIEESILAGKFIVPLLVDGGSMPTESVLPASIGAFANRQGYFVDSRSDVSFRAAMEALGRDFLSKFNSTILFARDESWPQRDIRNSLLLEINGKVSISLADFFERQNQTHLSPGAYTLCAIWDEEDKDSMAGTKYASYGFRSKGRTPPISIHFRPGTYLFSVKKHLRRRPTAFWASLLDSNDPVDHAHRTLELISFSAARAGDLHPGIFICTIDGICTAVLAEN